MHRYNTLISRAVVCTLKKQENSYNDSVSMEILEGYFVTVPLETSLEKKTKKQKRVPRIFMPFFRVLVNKLKLRHLRFSRPCNSNSLSQ